MTDEHFLSRWSRRKNQARRDEPVAPEAPSASEARPAPVPAAAPAATAPVEPLPPIESLTPESDFTGFLKPEVDEGLKRRALRTLFRDPQFNVMDGLDIYIDDYSKPDPLPEGWLAQLKQAARLGDYQEPKPEDAPEPPTEAGEVAVAGPEKIEKPQSEQGFVEDSSTRESDIPSAVIPPSAMRE